MRTNLLPAILIAGPPHSGKSVLSFLLTQKLREIGTSHYLLRAAPDGEGDWYHLGKAGIVRALRQKHKGEYSPDFVATVRSIVEQRHLPLLVDVGGCPQGEQFGILKACTHSILLYRTAEELALWESYLAEMDLLPIAELRSELEGDEAILVMYPVLQGIISGLDRDNTRTGTTFGALLDRVAGICHYGEPYLEQIHIQQAPYSVLIERQIALQINIQKEGKRLIWEPNHLPKVQEFIPAGEPRAVYGRGPVWLAGMLTAHISPSPLALFDARYGWLMLPEVCFQEEANVNVQVNNWIEQNAQCLSIELPQVEIEPEKICLQPIKGKNGLVLSGALPRWFFAALVRAFMNERVWIGIDEPAKDRVVIIYSNHPSKTVGETIPRPQALLFSSLE